MSNNICYETWLKEVSPFYYCISLKSILQMNNIFWRGRSFSSLQQGWFTDSSQCVMRLYTENYLTIKYNSSSVAHHWNEDKMPQDALHESDRRMQVKSWLRKWSYCIIRRSTKRGGSFILNYGGNKPHSSDINFDNGKTYYLENSDELLDMMIKNILPQNFKV